MPNIDIVKAVIFVVTITLGISVLIFLFNLFNVPDTIPADIVDIIDWLIAGSYNFDFIIPIKLLYQLFFWSIVSSLCLYVADGVLFVWKQISKIRS